MTIPRPKHIVLGVSASIAAYRACDLVMRLKEVGYRVTVVMSKDAHHFVSALTFQSLSSENVISDFFSIGANTKPVHTQLGQTADLILIAPASADIIAKLAHGLADDVICCAVLASKAPVMIVPAMNEHMLSHPMTQRNLDILKKVGYQTVDPIHGTMVCSGEGYGHIADTQDIVKRVQEMFARS